MISDTRLDGKRGQVNPEHGIPLTFEGTLAAHTDQFNAAVDAMAKDLASRSSKGELRIAKKVVTTSCWMSLCS